jgi:hypothetical protein
VGAGRIWWYQHRAMQTLRVAADVCEHSNRVLNLLAPPRRLRFVCPRGPINCYHARLFSVFRLPRPASELQEMAAVIG